MRLDTNNNTTGNQEAEERMSQDNPQRILEKRLAEIHARNGEKDPNTPASEEVSTGNIIAGAIATHEVIPPVAAVPLVGAVEAPASSEPAPEEKQEETSASAAAASPETNPSPATVLSPGELSGTATPSESSAAPQPAAAAGNPVEEKAAADQPAVAENPVEAATAPAAAGPESVLAGGTPAADQPAVDTPQPAENPVEEAATAPAAAGPDTVLAEGSPAAAPHTTGLLDDDHHDEHHEDLPEVDYSTLSVGELRQKLMAALKVASRKNSRQIYEMHRQYESKMASEKAEALHRFVAEGNDVDDFEFNAGLAHQEVEQAFQIFRENRNRDQRQEEEQRIKNLQRKKELLEQLREMVESPETRSSSEKIKSIQSEWKTIGPVPAGESQQLWSSYHALLDIFYNNRSIFFELKELDRRKNLQHKVQLCERAEALVDNPSINAALQELRNLHEEWKNVGPVPNEFRDSIWERFIQASEKIHARKKEFISERRMQEQDNLVKKQDLLTRIASFQHYQTDRINDWRDKTDEIQKLKEEWDSIGLVPKEKADEVNKQFWASYKAFFNHKNAFFKSLDEQKMQNLRMKTELCEQAESLKDSTEWDETKEKLIQLQKKWKTIGRVPDKYSDKLWNRFRAACNEFFDRKQNQAQQREVAINKASAEKMAFYEEVASRITMLNQEPGSLEELEAIRNKWESFESGRGHSKLDDRFFELLQKYVESIPGLSNEDKDNINIELQVDHIRQSPDAQHRLHQKEQSVRKEISHLENDIRTLKTNIEFFGRSKNAEKLREEYQARIDEAEHRIQVLQQQLYAFRSV